MRTYSEYMAEKMDFIRNQNCDWKVYTSAMENDSYHKEYVFENGAMWYEVMRPETKNAVWEGLVFPVRVFCTEYWNSADAKSKFVFEKM